MTAFCKICNAVFEEAALEEGACKACRELKAKPHATHPVFKSDDLVFEGRRPFPWVWVVLGLCLVPLLMILIPSDEGGVSLEGVKKITADEIVESLGDQESEPFVRSMVTEQENVLFEVVERIGVAQHNFLQKAGTCQTLEELHQTHVVSAHWLEGGDRLYTLSLGIQGKEFELRGTPKPPFTRHYLMGADGRVRMGEGRPATVEDPVVKRLVLQKKKK